MKKFLSNTIVQLLIAVIIGLLAGFVVNDAVLEVVICIKHITGQIIFFLVPLIILGFIAPSIAHLRSNASKMLLFAFGIAYLSSIGASFFGAAVGYNVIPFLHIADDAGGVVCRWCIHRSDVGALLDDDGIHRKVGGAFKDGVRSADNGGYRTDNAGGNCKRAASGGECRHNGCNCSHSDAGSRYRFGDNLRYLTL